MKFLQVLVTTCAVVGATSAFAGTITFDNAPRTFWTTSTTVGPQTGGGQDLGGFYQGVTFGEGAQITDQVLPEFPAHSGIFELTDNDPNNGTITMTFATAASGVSFWYNTEVGFTAKAFAPGGALLSTMAVGSTINPLIPSGTTAQLSFTGITGIGEVIITDNSDLFGTQGDFTVDDLAASTISGLPAVPEATSTAALLGIAGLGLAALRRKLAHR